MPDRILMPLLAFIGLALIAFSLVWPQGYGARSPGPFGSVPIQQTPEMRIKIQREKDAAALREQQVRQQVSDAREAATTAP
ncbi:hypothetical protein ASD21_14190 [Caulobacter sp. Root1455]|jgi:hypothetical protein|uniref:hypothetical protein n=1 Tax=unclassified Caulobacter TaxID=2648921 RepID=UPI0006F72889|nr:MULTISPECIES: hypothetical protein [unclassified Caulobacter]KQY30243.1 hypothetical protein ASD38_13255 [Caulobacter sp. Root487D2Y]KQY92541.1 hypothetical protein ASD21_14190 [Caulobacter sp. Root1455]